LKNLDEFIQHFAFEIINTFRCESVVLLRVGTVAAQRTILRAVTPTGCPKIIYNGSSFSTQ
jgi:hypothetical protein